MRKTTRTSGRFNIGDEYTSLQCSYLPPIARLNFEISNVVSKSNRRQGEYPNAGLKWEISNHEIGRIVFWFEISGAIQG